VEAKKPLGARRYEGFSTRTRLGAGILNGIRLLVQRLWATFRVEERGQVESRRVLHGVTESDKSSFENFGYGLVTSTIGSDRGALLTIQDPLGIT
jgi:hypothetical protein